MTRPQTTKDRDLTALSSEQPVSPVIEVRNLSFSYGKHVALKNISLSILPHSVTAFIGPSGCGKSTFLRCLNRMNDLIENGRTEGKVSLGGVDILSSSMPVTELRKRVGMVFQRSNPFPKSIYDNVAYGPRIHGMAKSRDLDVTVEKSLRAVALWDEVKDRLRESALRLSGGQQQRLCIARALAVQPDVLLMDEPCSALDPVATGKIEELLFELKERYTIVIVTHNMQQAARISAFTGFMLQGELVEFSPTAQIFQKPTQQRTEDYIRGRFG